MNFIDACGVLADSANLLIDDKMAHEAKAIVSDVVAAYDAIAPDWSKAPEGATYYAIDDDGTATFYWGEIKADMDNCQWSCSEGTFWQSAGACNLHPGISWKLCIWQRPEATP